MAYQTLPEHVMFRRCARVCAVAVACLPRHLCGDTSPLMYADGLISRREPTFEFEFEASLFAFAYDTPPFAFALL